MANPTAMSSGSDRTTATTALRNISEVIIPQRMSTAWIIKITKTSSTLHSKTPSTCQLLGRIVAVEMAKLAVATMTVDAQTKPAAITLLANTARQSTGSVRSQSNVPSSFSDPIATGEMPRATTIGIAPHRKSNISNRGSVRGKRDMTQPCHREQRHRANRRGDRQRPQHAKVFPNQPSPGRAGRRQVPWSSDAWGNQ